MNEGNASVIFLNRGTASYLSDKEPDHFTSKPSLDHVLCRDANGKPTAIYGADTWDLNPYRLSASRISAMYLTDLVDCEDETFRSQLIEEARFILYLLMYFSAGGHLGRLSASTILQYWSLSRQMAKFCASTLNNDLASGISLFELLSSSSYLRGYLGQKDLSLNQRKQTAALLGCLNSIDPEVLGFESCPRNLFNFERNDDKQHPVIPARIYIALMNHLDSLLLAVHPFRENIRNLIFEFEDPLAGRLIKTQLRTLGHKNRHLCRPTMEELIKRHGLEDCLYQIFPMNQVRQQSFISWLTRLHHVLKSIIHLYTGMRNEECNRMNYGSLVERQVTDPVIDEDGTILDSSRIVSLVTTTTKYTGYRKTETWLAPDAVKKAVELANSIVEGLARIAGRNPQDCPLFMSPGVLWDRGENKSGITNFVNANFRGKDSVLTESEFRITNEDLYNLSHTDPDRDFSQEPEFQEGEFWPITSHQFRRSLAFYAANSGFVSLGTVSTQFKHTSRMMTQYYARNHQNFLSIFGRWDEKGKKHVTPQSHIALDFQMSARGASINQLFHDVFESGSTLLGGTGSHLEKLKDRVEEGEISVLTAKEDTMKMAEKGEIAYRETLLGGCTKVGPCNDFLLGDVTACLSCAGANIREDKLLNCLSKAEEEMEIFPEGSAEHQIAKIEASKLADFRDKKLIKVSEG